MSSGAARACSLVAAIAIAIAARGSAAARPGPPPDPRRGERLDGRAPPRDPKRHAWLLPRALLAVPRAAAAIVFAPILFVVGTAERHHVWSRIYWTFTADDRKSGLRPLARFESGRRLSLGVRWFDRRTLGDGSLIELRFRGAAARSLLGELRVRPGPAFGLRARFERQDDERFTGTRGDLDAPVARYGYDRAFADVDAIVWRSPRIQWRASAELDVIEYRDGRVVDDDLPLSKLVCVPCGDAPGFEDGTRRAGATAELSIDTRVNPRHGGGLIARLHARWAHGFLDDPSHDLAARGSLGWAIDLHDRALLFRIDSGIVEPLGDAPVPFHYLLEASGSHGVRGVGSGLLRGSSVLIATAEYRWLITPSVDAELFVDWGGAFGRGFDGLDADTLHPSIGVGLRKYGAGDRYWERPLAGGIELAWSPDDGIRLQFSVEP